MYPADEGVSLGCVSGRMGTGIWEAGLGGRFRERAWRPGYGDIGMGMEYGDIGMGIGTQPYLSVSGCTSSRTGVLPAAGASASEKGFLPVAGTSASEKGFLPVAGASASGKRVLPAAGASASEKFSFSFLEPSLRT